MESIFKRSGVFLTRATMSNWLIKVYKSLEPFLNLFMQELKKGHIVNIDESPLQVIKEDGRSAKQQSYMWLFSFSAKGAKTTAALYSINETAKANGLDEYYYWLHLLKHLPFCETEEDYLKLLPTRISEKEIMDTS